MFRGFTRLILFYIIVMTFYSLFLFALKSPLLAILFCI
ncbi:hypothetical protein CG09_0327 [Riemerella anatipestifer]|nr:hypothetical protein CG09_0327 [Riemerella anatipestifer]